MKFRLHAIKSILSSDLFLPAFLLIVYIVFLIIARGVIPTSDELIQTFASLYASYGYQIIFLAAALEAMVLINFFAPGQIAMAMGAIFASTGQIELSFVVLTATSGVMFGYCIDYLLGYFGFSDVLKKMGYKDFVVTADKKLKEFGDRGLILGFIHTTTASFLSLTAGVIGMNFFKFFIIALCSSLVWLSMWGSLFFMIGEPLLKVITRYSFLILIVILAGLFLLRLWKKGKK